jgi:hypothetical protein
MTSIRSPWDSVIDAFDPPQRRWLEDPSGWAVERGVTRETWSGQRRIMDSVRDHAATAVPTCHTIGKDYTAAMITCWWLDVHPPGSAFVLTTAPTGAQVKGILWRYINRMADDAELAGRRNLTEWYIGNELVALGRKPSEYAPGAFQGWHARYMLVIFDEACAMPDSLWNEASTLTSNRDARFLAIGNPDDPNTKFFQVCQPGSGWNVVTIAADDTPAWTGEPVSDDLLAVLISREWAEKKAQEWGVDSPLYTSKVLGRFPIDARDGIIPNSWLTPCRRMSDPTSPPLPLTTDVRAGGLDVGESESSDRMVLYERVGMRAGRYEVIPHGGDAMRGVGQVIKLINEWELERVVVDVIGIGWGVHSRLRELSHRHNPTDHLTTHRAELVRFSAGEKSESPAEKLGELTGQEKFYNKRAELWWNGRELSRSLRWDLSAIDDDTAAELVCPKYFLNGSRQRIQVEAKDDVRERLGRSPDLADALLMSFWEGDRLPPASTVSWLDHASQVL